MKTLKKLIWIVIILLAGCDKEDAWDFLKTRGDYVVEQRTIPACQSIQVYNGINVTISQGDSYSVVVEGWKNLMPKIVTTVDNDGALIIKDENRFNFVRNRDNMTTVHLTLAGELNQILYSSNGYFTSNDTIFTSGLTLLCLESSGSLDLIIKTPGLYIGSNHQNIASINISGWSNDIGMTNWGYSPVDLSELKASTAHIHHHSPANLYVNASESLSVVIYGSGDVYYLGNPTITFSRVAKGKGNLLPMK